MRAEHEMTSDLVEAATGERARWAAQPFGKYFLVQRLAEGGMAEIFLAKQTGIEGFERNLVIKRMLPHLSRQPHFVGMFLDEARLAARLVHPNIMPIYDVGLADGSYYITMEYLPGEDLSWVLRQAALRRLQLPLDMVVRIIADAARGLDYAHRFTDEEGRPLHVVHRDVSPSNLYVGYEGAVKVLDFGIAKAESRVTTTGTGMVRGKQMYMAPEQSRGESVDCRCDIYALGVTLYEALTISRPFLRDTVDATVSAVLQGQFEPPRRRRPELPEALEAVVLRAMALDPDARYQSAGELADALDGQLAAVMPAGAAPSVGRQLRELCGEVKVTCRTRIPSLASLQQRGVACELAPWASHPERAATADAAPPPTPAMTSPTTSALTALATVEASPSSLERSSPSLWRLQRRLWSRKGPVVGAAGAATAALLALAVGATVGWRRPMAVPVPPGCGARWGSDAPDAIVFGATLPLSVAGSPEDAQAQLLNAMRLALDEINQRDGVAGRRFALAVCDNAGDVARLKPQVRWLVDSLRVPALVTSWSSLTLAAVNQTLPRGVLTMTADATSPELAAVPASDDAGVRLLWRTAPSDALLGAAMAHALATEPGVERIAIVYQDDPYGQGQAAVLLRALPRLRPGLAVRAIQYPFRGDVASAVAQLGAWRPQLTVLIGFPLDGVRLLNLAARAPALTRAAGHRWFFSDGMKEPTLFAGLAHPEEIDGTRGIEPAPGGGAETRSFHSRFQARFLRDAANQTYAAHRYDAVYVLALAAASAAGRDGRGVLTGRRLAEGIMHLVAGPRMGLTPDSFTAAKARLQRGESIDIEGASGGLDFDRASGGVDAVYQLWRVDGRGFVPDRRLGDR
jgi:serine/threonine-protein kinase